jgi:hypothetical protein
MPYHGDSMRSTGLRVVVACAASVACNAVSGVDDLQFGGRDATGSAATTGAVGGRGGTTSAGDGGSGNAASVGGAGGCGACKTPPTQCHAGAGRCDRELGECVYAPLPARSPCEDGSGCTVGDQCDGTGSCVPGPLCPNLDLCKFVQCVADECASSDVADGTSCGNQPAARCCGGSCVDISVNTSHCGGCGSTCSPNQACESVANTATCEPSPEHTTGRCMCDSTSECPEGQICRTTLPYAGRCTPDDASGCVGKFTNLDLCPNYCGY